MAEGLIPFVFRAIERRKSNRRYQTLSHSASAAAGAAAAAIVAAARIPEDEAVTEFGRGFPDGQYRHQPQRMSADGLWAPSTLELGGGGNQQQNNHRRWATVDDYAFEEHRRQQHQPPLAKARSSRMFSCIKGM